MDAIDGANKTRGPLHAEHEALGATFGEFSGWLMPLQYPAGVLAEHAAVRERVGVFDVSHLGTVRVSGAGAAGFLNECFTNDLDRIGAGRAQYTLACDAEGGVVDDLIVYRIGDDDLLCVPNAANTAVVAELLAAEAPAAVTVRNTHGSSAILAVQGPRSRELLAAVGLPSPETYLGFAVADGPFGETMVCRSGYTGELGFELILPAEQAPGLWRALLAAGAEWECLPCGLGARDTLRTEMGYPLHGHELSTQITPVEAGLSWAVGWKKPQFWGRDALLEQRERGADWACRGLLLPRGPVPRPGMPVLDGGMQPVGEVTSGTFSPTLRTPIALARVRATTSDAEMLTVEIRNRTVTARVAGLPFVHPSGLRG